MSDHFFPSRDTLKGIVKAAVGPLVDVSWDYEPVRYQGFGGLGQDAIPLPGMPLASPATSITGSGGAVQVTLKIIAWTSIGWDDTRRSIAMTAWTVAGDTPPSIVLAGDPDLNLVKQVNVRVTLAGARGTWTGEYSLDRGTTWTAFTSAEEVDLTGSGLTLQIATGNASLNNTWESIPAQVLEQVGRRNFTLSIKVEADRTDAFALCERINYYWNFKSTVATLPAYFMALREVSDTVSLPETNWDGKTIQAASCDVLLAYSGVIVDSAGETDTVDNNWIETAGLVNGLSS